MADDDLVEKISPGQARRGKMQLSPPPRLPSPDQSFSVTSYSFNSHLIIIVIISKNIKIHFPDVLLAI